MRFWKNFQFVIAISIIHSQLTRAIIFLNHHKILIQYSTRAQFPSDDLTRVQFLLDNENITLNLRKSFLIGSKTPVWLMKQTYYGSRIEETDPFTLGKAAQFYVDEDKNASIAVTTNNYGEKKFMGFFGRRFIRPMQYSRSFERKLRSINQRKVFPKNVNSSVGVFITDYHIISEMPNSKLAENIITLSLGARPHSNSNSSEEHIYKREAPDTATELTVYPGILIIADYNIEFPTPSESRFYNFLMYIVAFWNSVDIRFRGLKDPRIRLRISGIIVAMNHKSVPFFESNLDRGVLKVGLARHKMGDWLLQNDRVWPITSYNIAVAMTNLSLCLINPNGHCGSTKVTGMAKVIGVTCTPDGSYTVHPTAIINDYLDFSGVLRATHEIGHLFGADHDGSKGNEDCDNSNDNVMATTDEYEPSKHIWSKCSQRSISKFLKSGQADCLRNIIPPGEGGDSTLQTISLQDQCNLSGFTHACDPKPETCSGLQCRSTGWAGFSTIWRCINVGPALKGSPCGIGFCRNNSCVPSMNPIPGDFGSGLS